VGGNVDRERFLEEVLIPLSKNETVNYRRFNCSTMTINEGMNVVPERLTVIEGTYSMHPELSDHYDLSVFLDVDPKLQEKRIANRNSPELAERFFD
jgi:uridine kinase